MKLDQHISDLLLYHDCVVLPGLGGFVSNYAPARIDTSKNIFYPPSRSVLFNSSLTINDGLLASYISRKESVSFETAVNYLKIFVEECKEALGKNQKLDIKDIGHLYRDKNNNIHFEPELRFNLLLDAFGLPELSIAWIERESYRNKIEKKVMNRPPLPQTRERKLIYRRVAIAGASLLLLFSLAWFPFKAGLLDKTAFSSFNIFADKAPALYQVRNVEPESFTPLKESSLLELSLSEGYASVNFTDTVAAPIVVKLSAEAEPDKTKVSAAQKDFSSKQYHIVAGCFAIYDNAMKLMQELQQKKFNAVMPGKTSKGLYIVSCGSYASRNEAVAALRRYQAAHDPKAWIVKK